MNQTEVLSKLTEMLELTKAERSAIDSEDFEQLESILLKKERLMNQLSISFSLDAVDEIRDLANQISDHGKENQELVHRKWLDSKDELKKIAGVRKTLRNHAQKQKLTPRIIDKKC